MSPLLLKAFCDLGDLSKKERMGHTMFNTHGKLPFGRSVRAKVAQLNNSLLGIKLRGRGWAGLNAEFAPCARLWINRYHPQRPTRNGFDRTGLHAFGVDAVHAANHVKIEPEPSVLFVGSFPKDANAVKANGACVFLFACHFTGLAPHTEFRIKDDPIMLHVTSPPPCKLYTEVH
jgi:hypothetical protein